MRLRIRFNLRHLLGGIALAALAFLVIRLALRSSGLGFGLLAAGLTAFTFLAAHVALYGFLVGLGALEGSPRADTAPCEDGSRRSGEPG